MNIELTTEQSAAVGGGNGAVVVIDPRTKQAFRLVREEDFQMMQALMYDDSEWTPGEMAGLAAGAFAGLDDTDYLKSP